MPNHDQLQALVTGYAGLAIAAAHRQGVELVGQAPFALDGHIREGFIACPLRPAPALASTSAPRDTAAITEIPPEQVPLALLLLADPSESKVRGYLPGARCFAALHGGQVAGVCAVVPLTPGVHELMNIAVDPARQQHGLGTQLLVHVIDTYRREGAARLEVGTGAFGYQLAFYQRHGFRVFQVDRGFFLRNYDGPLMEDRIQHKDMLRLAIDYPATA
ncbi:GNAT family N-acetyltransferase [Stenotrophomonas sp. CPCC 101365]|uniref:GNAT family N-acetyltransferase n=2 Tax=Stenotrophomonas mori TaxID=2871096 RepID=A0ABT0SKW8_9GAMM|nr:GNAT family N-acetyltransferase [Stenotrophomonas mori]